MPLRAGLLRIAADQHVIVLAVHHIAADQWSARPLLTDLATAYAARTAGEEPAWPPLPVQYADFTLWQRSTLGWDDDAPHPDGAAAAQLDHWRTALEASPAELPLPTDRPRPHPSHRGGFARFTVPPETHTAMRTLARTESTSLFMVAHAALAALLSRTGGGHDIVVGTPVAGRHDTALDDLVGFFVNNLVLRTDLSGDPTFHELLRRVRETDLAAYAHADVPFEHLVDALAPHRSLARHPLFQVMLAYENRQAGEIGLPGLTTTTVPAFGRSAKFDLTFTLAERAGADGIEGVLEYAEDLFDPATAQGLADRLVRLLTEAVAAPSTPLHRLEILSPAERAALLGRPEDAEAPHGDASATLPGLFAAVAAAHPDAPRARRTRPGHRGARRTGLPAARRRRQRPGPRPPGPGRPARGPGRGHAAAHRGGRRRPARRREGRGRLPPRRPGLPGRADRAHARRRGPRPRPHHPRNPRRRRRAPAGDDRRPARPVRAGPGPLAHPPRRRTSSTPPAPPAAPRASPSPTPDSPPWPAPSPTPSRRGRATASSSSPP